MQKKVLAKLTKAIEDLGLEVCNLAVYANTGRLSIQHPDEIGEVASISYDFQNSWGTMKFKIKIGNNFLLSQPPRQNYVDFYMDYTDNAGFVAFFRRMQNALKQIAG